MFYVSTSRLTTFAKCPKSYEHHYISNRKRIATPHALTFGTLFHKCLEYWWKSGIDTVVEYLTENAGAIDPVDACKISAMLVIYNPPHEKYEVIGTEVPFTVTIENENGNALHGVRLRGYIDLILKRMSDSKTVLVEHKTTSDQIIGFGPYWARLAIDDQVSNYALAFDADEVIYDVCKKSLLKVSKADRKAAGKDATEADVIASYGDRVASVLADAPDEHHQWRSVHKSKNDLAEARRSLCQRTVNLRDAIRTSSYPRYPHSCRSMYGVCAYLDVCAGRASLSDDTLFCERKDFTGNESKK